MDNKITCTDVFKTSIFSYYLNFNKKEVQKFCISYQKKNKGRKVSNEGGYQSDNLNLKLPMFKGLNISLNQIVNFVSKEFYGLKKELKINQLWFNINKYKDHNIVHQHPKSILSGVFYVNTADKCGDIVFIRDKEISAFLESSSIENFNSINSSIWKFPAKENTLYVFPSWLNHYVEPNLSKKNRISFSFNTSF